MPTWNRKWKLTSFTDPGKEYTVSEGTAHIQGKPATAYGCSCPAWRFAKKNPITELRPNCKHIAVILGRLKMEKQIAVEEETRLLLDIWAVEEVGYVPMKHMLNVMEDRS